MHVRILALDLATKTGWAIGESGKIVESGVQDFSVQRGESPGMRFLYFRSWLETLLTAIKPTLIVYEMPHLRGGATATVLVGLETRVHEVAAQRGIEYTKVHSAKVKKAVLGSGKATKEQVIEWAVGVLGRPPASDDEADAVAILTWATRQFTVPGSHDEADQGG